MKTYTLYYTFSRLNVTFHRSSSSSPAEPAVYYGEYACLGYVTNKPQIILRHGSTKNAPIVAAAKMHTVSRDIQLCLGDYERGDVVWEDMRRDKTRLLRGDYTFSAAVESVGGSRRTYTWKHAKKMGRTVYECVDNDGAVVATFASGGMLNWKKAGVIEVAEDVDGAIETLLLVGATAIFVAEAGWSVGKGYA